MSRPPCLSRPRGVRRFPAQPSEMAEAGCSHSGGSLAGTQHGSSRLEALTPEILKARPSSGAHITQQGAAEPEAPAALSRRHGDTCSHPSLCPFSTQPSSPQPSRSDSYLRHLAFPSLYTAVPRFTHSGSVLQICWMAVGLLPLGNFPLRNFSTVEGRRLPSLRQAGRQACG